VNARAGLSCAGREIIVLVAVLVNRNRSGIRGHRAEDQIDYDYEDDDEDEEAGGDQASGKRNLPKAAGAQPGMVCRRAPAYGQEYACEGESIPISYGRDD